MTNAKASAPSTAPCPKCGDEAPFSTRSLRFVCRSEKHREPSSMRHGRETTGRLIEVVFHGPTDYCWAVSVNASGYHWDTGCPRRGSVEEPETVDSFDYGTHTVQKVANVTRENRRVEGTDEWESVLVPNAGLYCRQHSPSLKREREAAEQMSTHLASQSRQAAEQSFNTRIVLAVSRLKAMCTDEASAQDLRFVLGSLNRNADWAVREAGRQ